MMTIVTDYGYNSGMKETIVQASTFKATCLALLDEVEATHGTIIVTKRGRPVAKLVPVSAPQPTMGSVTLLAPDDADYLSTDEAWDAVR